MKIKKLLTKCATTCATVSTTSVFLIPATANAAQVWINEIHYDNAGTDTNEGVELLGEAGSSIDGWSLLLYNGGNGSVYRDITLAGSFADEESGFGSLSFELSGIQNGAPDGIAIADENNNILEFLSYEGTLVATDGAANGLLSVDIGISETSLAPLNTSLQRVGSGSSATDFTWVSQTQSFGSINTGQTLTPNQAVVPLPAALPLYTLTLLGLWRCKHSRVSHHRQQPSGATKSIS